VTGPGSVAWVVASAQTARRWALAIEGAGVAAMPLAWSEVVPPGRPDALAEALGLPFDLLVLASPNAVRWVPSDLLRGRPAACVGTATARSAVEAGLDVRFSGDGGTEDLAHRILERVPGAMDLLVLRGREARAEGIDALRAAGRRVRSAIAYETRPRPAFTVEVKRAPAPSAFVVGSPRAADALGDALRATGRDDVRSCPAVAPGGTTAARLGALGFSDVRTAARADADAIVARLAQH
jgi:uroporphyrinogen-III synthase